MPGVDPTGKTDYVFSRLEKLRLDKLPVSPPRPKGPPLNALRAFEAAARLGGFALAAEELCVTPGAVSQHIKVLEDWSGAALFERRSHGVRLTKAGASLLPDFTAAFDQLGQATRGLRSLAPVPVVQVAALPSVAQLWLAPRLAALRSVRPGARVSVTALESPPNLSRDMFDLSLFIAHTDDGHEEHILELDVIFPVCAPGIAEQISEPSDLAEQTLLIDAAWPDDWPLWADHAGVVLPAQADSASFSLYAMAQEEARAGAGILMAHGSLVEAALDAGSLVRPFELFVPTGKALILTAAPGSEDLVGALRSNVLPV